MSWALTFLGFVALIVLHEFGHFIAAKAVGMRVERFSLFFPPKLFGVRRGETEYMIGAIPAGGYVKITGMSPNEEIPPEVVERAYYRQPVWKRLVVIGAGPAMNLLVAFLILWGLYALSAQQPRTDRVSIATVQAGRPAAAALRKGDVLIAVDGRPVRVSSNGQVNSIALISAHRCSGRQVEGCAAATPVRLTVLRAGRRLGLAVTPRYDAKLKRPLIGIEMGPVDTTESPGRALGSSVSQMWHVTSLTVSRISQVFVSESARKEVHSIVGISDVASEEFSYSASAALYLLAIISLSLAIINLFPFLPLDGGHIFWALAEKVRGRPIPFAVMERASVVGFALVIFLFLIGFTNDLHTLSNGGFHIH
ncbi:MAG TPA: M50 family metallopeptidase [Solirubrobacteraceae bacterium]|jgi:regulator of sigma E protease|nr:M50 family metallopeptidase [Solirubrobacteraceae bacterium]